MRTTPALLLPAALAAALLFPAATAEGHCDSLKGPVVTDARAALAKGEIAPVLKWVAAGQEPELREAFRRSVAVRGLGAEARQLADTAFFETLVRLHRHSEGAPYTGLKPGGDEPAFIGRLESSLAAGSVDDFAALVGAHATAAVKARFAKALEARRKADASAADGRAWVAAYVDLMHGTKAIVEAVHGGSESHAAPATAAPRAPGHTCD